MKNIKTLFLDANILFSAAYSEHAGIARLWKFSDVMLVSSFYAVEEAQRNLPSIKQQQRLEKLLLPVKLVSEQANNKIPKNVKLRDKDIPILAAAIFAKADYLITGDYRDFGRYFGRTIADVKVLPPADYFKVNKES